jgi:hypothetical protein
LITVEEAETDERESHVDVGVACIINCEKTVGEKGVGDEEWKDVEAEEESTGAEEFEIYSIGVH